VLETSSNSSLQSFYAKLFEPQLYHLASRADQFYKLDLYRRFRLLVRISLMMFCVESTTILSSLSLCKLCHSVLM